MDSFYNGIGERVR